MVKVKASGAGEIVEITISPEVIDERRGGSRRSRPRGREPGAQELPDLMQSKLGGAMGNLKGLGLPGL